MTYFFKLIIATFSVCALSMGYDDKRGSSLTIVIQVRVNSQNINIRSHFKSVSSELT